MSEIKIKIPAQLEAYVKAVGIDAAVDFFLAFGGSYVYLSESPQERSPIAQQLGRDGAIALAKAVGTGSIRVPTAKPFIAVYFRVMKQWTVNRIARELHVTDVSVRGWLSPPETKQMDLFGS